MEDIQKVLRDKMKDLKLSIFTKPSSTGSTPFGAEGAVSGSSAALCSPEQAAVLFNRNSRQVVSLWTCSKLCAFFFVAGVFAGYTLKRRVRRWASKLLGRLKEQD